MARNFVHFSLHIKQRATRQIYANEATCRLQENPLRLIMTNYICFPLSFYMAQQLARNIFYDVKRIITPWKSGSGSLMLFLIPHVICLESACSSCKLLSSVYWMMHTCIIRKNIIVTYFNISLLLLFYKKLRSKDPLLLAKWKNGKHENPILEAWDCF